MLTAFSLLFPPILDEFGWDRGMTAGAFSIGFLISAKKLKNSGRTENSHRVTTEMQPQICCRLRQGRSENCRQAMIPRGKKRLNLQEEAPSCTGSLRYGYPIPIAEENGSFGRLKPLFCSGMAGLQHG